MFFNLCLFLFTAQVALVAALGKLTVANRCSRDMYVWSVDGQGSSRAIKINARSRYTEPIRTSCNGCGVTLKVSRTLQLIGGHHSQFEYAISNNVMYYDISFVDCAKGQDASNCPGHVAGLEIYSPNERKCDRVTCSGNSYCPTKAYYVDQPNQKLGIPEPVYGCGDAGTGADLVFVLCQNQRSV
ncbi:hypothetical protein DPSP01_014114 [Paraphaeosphaeria sporulosa]|uniref:Uncharacterized protein n=1 Tax=Paraphaeosphaeria sporulosa TaxID=1460663 RepID=A0A177C4R9_9PLEO|nr:uncharacterized protein CC84DRAFT_1098617 [Paraphaeosphaeria sporulosa]OAG01879.1 hypothetical protein CC84DRAFT_1098617 [Paraphaeosphaeria sporulosa]